MTQETSKNKFSHSIGPKIEGTLTKMIEETKRKRLYAIGSRDSCSSLGVRCHFSAQQRIISSFYISSSKSDQRIYHFLFNHICFLHFSSCRIFRAIEDTFFLCLLTRSKLFMKSNRMGSSLIHGYHIIEECYVQIRI